MTITKINNTSFMFEFLQDELTFNTEDDLIYHIMNIVATVEKLNTKHCAFVLEVVKSRKGSSYSRLMGALHAAGIEINRKVLADLAVNHPEAFKAIVAKVK